MNKHVRGGAMARTYWLTSAVGLTLAMAWGCSGKTREGTGDDTSGSGSGDATRSGAGGSAPGGGDGPTGSGGSGGLRGSSGSGGSGGSLGSGGSGGSGAPGGSGNTPACDEGAAGAGGEGGASGEYSLEPFNGWVDRCSNDFGIQGALYTFGDEADGGAFLIEPDSFASAGDEICVHGTSERVIDGQFGVYWGGAIGFNLHQEEGNDTPALPYDARANGVTGFGFDISELPAGGQLRFNVLVAGEPDNNYCAPINTESNNEFRWDDLRLSCWAPEDETPDATKIQAVHWQIVTRESVAYDFDFCLDNLHVLTD